MQTTTTAMCHYGSSSLSSRILHMYIDVESVAAAAATKCHALGILPFLSIKFSFFPFRSF